VGNIANASPRWLSPAGLDLAEKLLTYDPMKRISALQAMDTPYFIREAPSASKPVGCVIIVFLFSFLLIDFLLDW
jgi:serine/threonine protein kinase